VCVCESISVVCVRAFQLCVWEGILNNVPHGPSYMCAHTHTHTQPSKQCCYVCVHMSTSSQWQTHRNRQSERAARGGEREDELLGSRCHRTWSLPGSRTAETQRGFFLFWWGGGGGVVNVPHASLTVEANPDMFLFVFPLRSREREMCGFGVLHWTRYRDHHWEHCKYPQWVKHTAGRVTAESP